MDSQGQAVSLDADKGALRTGEKKIRYRFDRLEAAGSLGDLKVRKDLFVALLMLGITPAANLAAGFVVGIVAAYVLKSEKLSV